MGKFYDVKVVKDAANGGWAGILGRLGADAGLLTDEHSACPGCGGKDRFRFDDKGGDGSWLCSGGGNFESGDGFALLMHIRHCEWKDAVNEVGELLGCEAKVFEGRGGAAAAGGSGSARKVDGVAGEPVAPKAAKVSEVFDAGKLAAMVAGVPAVDEDWLIARSPVDPRGVMPGEFINACFSEGERVLVFSNFFSQGDFAWEVGRGGFRLGANPETKAVKSSLPVDGGKKGVWYLCNPVSLRWLPKPDGELGRRFQDCVTSWRYLVLESDVGKELRKAGRVAEAIEVEGNWFKFLACLEGEVRAIYSSGGGSWHALVDVKMGTKADMDGLLKGNAEGKSMAARMGLKRVLSIFGADPGALTPVRLTRLPGCTRGGREQRLVYLRPLGAEVGEGRIVDMVPRREVK